MASSTDTRLAAGTRVNRRVGYLAPTAALTAAGVMLAISLFLPYWKLNLVTPSHPGGLRLVAYLGHLEGPLDSVLVSADRESDARLQELSTLEQSFAIAMGTVISLLVIAATFVHNRWAALLSLPALCFPAIVIADTTKWLGPIVAGVSGEGLTHGALNPFLFERLATRGGSLDVRPGAGLIMAAAASVMVLLGLWLHRRAYKPGSETSEEEGGRRLEPDDRVSL